MVIGALDACWRWSQSRRSERCACDARALGDPLVHLRSTESSVGSVKTERGTREQRRMAMSAPTEAWMGVTEKQIWTPDCSRGW